LFRTIVLNAPVLEAIDLGLFRGPRRLFEGLSFRVGPGTALWVRGQNGAGKTTLLRVLCGLTQPERGRVLWRGRPAGPEFSGQLAYGGHLLGLKSDLTVLENLRFFARQYDVDAGACDAQIEQVGLHRCRHLEVRLLSAGQKRRAALARIFLSGATAWVLDEPFANLDEDGRRLVEAALAAHLKQGGLAVVAAHQSMTAGDVPMQTITLGEKT
jgi:heme exporter protein A